MDYATNYDVGEQKRDRGINEDSVAITVFEQGHRDGVEAREGDQREPSERRGGAAGDRDGDQREPSERRGGAAGDRDGDQREPSDRGGGLAADREDDHRQSSERGAGGAPDSQGTDPDDATESAAGPPGNRSAAVVALADGAGGHEAGDVASYLATTVVCERLAETAIRASRSDPAAFDLDVREPLPPMQTPTELREAVAAAVEAAHRAILAYAGDTRQAAYSTVVAGLVVDGTFHYAWVGDSRAYVCNREHETIERLTADHGVVAKLAEAGEIDDVEAMVHPRTNEITRALGGTGPPVDGEATVEVDTNSVDIYGDDVVLLTSDGLVDAQTDAPALYDEYLERDRETAVADEVREAVVTDAEISETILTADTLDAAATDLVRLANTRGGKDNISTLLFADPVLPAAPPDPPARDVREVPPVGDRDTRLISEG